MSGEGPRVSRRRMLLSALSLSSVPALAEHGRASVAAGANAAGSKLPAATVFRSEQLTLKAVLGKPFVIQVGLPNEADPDLPLMVRGRKPAVLYVLDGDVGFGMVTDMTRLMQWGGDVPPCLVVGITYPDEYLNGPVAQNKNPRNFDLTPTSDGRNPRWSKAENVGGGGSAFLAFLMEKLQPLIHERYEVDPESSVLIGHSLGGLFAIGAATQRGGAFRHYLVLSPSLWWDERYELKRFERRLKEGFHHPGRLAVFVGDREERISGAYSSMVGNVVALKGVLDNFPTAFEQTMVQILPDEDHHTLHGTAISRGLRFLLQPA